MALIETGQRHTGHGHKAPVFGEHACARKLKKEGKDITYCRYDFPRDLFKVMDDILGHVQDDRLRTDLRNLLLERNDTLINNYEFHLLLMNLGDIDWRALLNLWSALEYLTTYNATAGQGSKHLGKLIKDVLSKV